MLKALEIVGFKSFADKTRFDFPPGITVVVGPNGSGKSNVVDAIKWVLGEQSAKSLRGKDMSDVIFKGVGSSNGRRPSNTAEATIVLDNVDGRLENDAEEIHVTRRVYRSGEGEYLINGTACRLKDIKDLFRGTGIGTDAYSLIEQGKVDRLLQASTKDRRAIFEEAAGISRFKAKKVEAQRRLARVEQNLLRLSDIVEEVGSRYRSVKAQASKASRYKEYADRLRQLRIEISYRDWESTAESLQHARTQKKDLAGKMEVSEGDLERAGLELGDYQKKINQFSDTLLELENKALGIRETVSKLETTISSESRRESELVERQSTVSSQLTELQDRLTRIVGDREKAEQEKTEAGLRLDDYQAKLLDITGLIKRLEKQIQTLSDSEKELVEKQAVLEKNWADQQRKSFELETETKTFEKSCDKLQIQLDEVTVSIQGVAIELSSVEAAEKQLEEETSQKDSALAKARREILEKRSQFDSASHDLQELKSEKSGMVQRAKVIEQLEKRLEGIQSGAKNVLARAKSEPNGPFAGVHGLVADIIQVHVQHATLIDHILGEWAQFVVCNGPSLHDWLKTQEPDIAGRVGFFCLVDSPQPTVGHNVDLSGLTGVVGRADQVVRVDPEFQRLIDYLLGNAWIVRSLKDAIRLRENNSATVRYVSLASEVLEPDGSIVMGPTASELGLISRRSELRSLKHRIVELQQSIETTHALAKSLDAQVKSGEKDVDRLLNEHSLVSQQLSGHQLRRSNLQDRLDKASKDRAHLSQELEIFSKKKVEARDSLASLTTQMKSNDQELQAVVSSRASIGEQCRVARELFTSKTAAFNGFKLDHATELKTVEGLDNSLIQLNQSGEETQARLQESNEESHSNQERIVQSQEIVTASGEQLDGQLAAQDQLTHRILQHSDERKAAVSHRDRLQESYGVLQENLKKWQASIHGFELEIGQLENQQNVVEERLRDDYGLEITEIVKSKLEMVIEDREAAELEVESLRKKITSIGAVNTDALIELEDLEDRFHSLNGQFQDLVKAKDSLERIIVRINTDSRKIFVETLEAIRKNFQTLYRRNFGGGKADIILEEGLDELEAGIDIVATPPGKAEFSNSLLSGGEKALTAVSLLLAIFQFRPSPFCVLDEVDAPFDEANIGRFVEVLKGFLGWTRFVVVTHSKKTMTAADTLYGVTMLESGISNKVSVRFEDVDEKGNISKEAIVRSASHGKTVA